jgi:hypothetical protein
MWCLKAKIEKTLKININHSRPDLGSLFLFVVQMENNKKKKKKKKKLDLISHLEPVWNYV